MSLPSPGSRYDPANEAETRRAIQATQRGLENRVRVLETVVRMGAGSPEGVVAAPVGTLFLRTDGGATTTLYVKTSGTGTTGWTAK